MGIVKDFYDELASFVNVEITVGGYDGVDLTPGEEFDLNIRISNSSDLPFLSFKIISCYVFDTINAEPIQWGFRSGEEAVEATMFMNQEVYPKSNGFSDTVRMKAIKANPESSSPLSRALIEKVAKVEVKVEWLTANFLPFTVGKTVKYNIKPS